MRAQPTAQARGWKEISSLTFHLSPFTWVGPRIRPPTLKPQKTE